MELLLTIYHHRAWYQLMHLVISSHSLVGPQNILSARRISFVSVKVGTKVGTSLVFSSARPDVIPSSPRLLVPQA